MPLGPVISVFVETLILAPLALALALGDAHAAPGPTSAGGPAAIFGHDLGTSAMLACSGPLTGGPLILFSYAARRIPYATLGLVQYLNPTLQFMVAVALFGEPFTVLARDRLPADLGRARALFVGGLASGEGGAQPGDEPRHGVLSLEEAEEARVGEALGDDVVEERERAGPSSR